MLKIGVLGDEDGTAGQVIKEILEKNQKSFYFSKAASGEEIRFAFADAVTKKKKVILLDMNLGEDYENMKTMKFDILVFLTKKERDVVELNSLLKEKNYLILDIDSLGAKKIMASKNTTVVTCGFNHSASATISSVEWEFANELQFCFQRTLETIDGSEIEPQEIKFAKNYENRNIVSILAAVVAAALTGARV